MQGTDVDWESRIDNVNREDIWKTVAEEWLEKFKSEETPIEKRITDYEISAWSVNANNEKEINIFFQFQVTPVDENNTEWGESYNSNMGFLEMTNVDGEYKVDYLSDLPKNYDKFLEEFEKWQKENVEIETHTVQAEKEEFNSEVLKINNTIVGGCVVIIAIVVIVTILKILKRSK